LQRPRRSSNASLTALEAQNLPAPVAQAIHTRQARSDAVREHAQVEQSRCRLINWSEHCYPHLQRQIYDPPPLLYVKGNVELLDRHSIAMVGALRPTPYGIKWPGAWAGTWRSADWW
jgi:DNA processing protein